MILAYIGSPSGTEPCLFEAVEYGLYSDPRQKSPLATTNGVLLINGGTTALPMVNFNYALIAPTTGYLYSGETVTTGFYVNGAQIKLCKPGCRPGKRQQLYRFINASYGNTTKYINSFSDGEVWVSDSSGARAGTKISKKLADWNTYEDLPCGMLYSVCCLGQARLAGLRRRARAEARPHAEARAGRHLSERRSIHWNPSCGTTVRGKARNSAGARDQADDVGLDQAGAVRHNAMEPPVEEHPKMQGAVVDDLAAVMMAAHERRRDGGGDHAESKFFCAAHCLTTS
jgi:hypothetical protein